jgi:glycosyltransferase involved in cell wall biosynthesis
LPEVREFEAVAAKAGLAEVTMARHASHEEVPWYIAAASVCVAPLAARTAKRVNSVVPLKLLAYLACGRPAVTPDLRFLRFVQEESFGYVYRSGDAASLAGAIEKALCMTADQRVRLAAAAADYVRSGHSWHLVGDITEEFMRARIAAHRGLAAG